MNYHAPTKQFTVTPEELSLASLAMLYAIKNIRNGANIDLKGYDYLNRASDWAEYAEAAILNAACDLGINLGSDRPGKIDVSTL